MKVRQKHLHERPLFAVRRTARCGNAAFSEQKSNTSHETIGLRQTFEVMGAPSNVRLATTQHRIADTEAQCAALLPRIMQAIIDAVIGAYETKIIEGAKSAEKLAEMVAKPKRHENHPRLSQRPLSSL